MLTLKEKKEPTYVVSVAADVRDVVRLGVYFDKVGVYRAAKPAGMLRFAIKLLVNILDGSGDLVPVDSHAEAMRLWGALRYPREQLDDQLSRQQCAIELEARNLYGPAARSISKMREEIYRMTDEQRGRLAAQAEEAGMTPAALAAEKERVVKIATASGTIISDDTRSTGEINTERAALDAERLRKEREAILAGLAGSGVQVADPGEFEEFEQVAANIVAAQPYVGVNAEPALAVPGKAETQESLRKKSVEMKES